MNEERGSWYLLTAILLGIGLGLLYSWVIDPAEYIDTPPNSLREDFKDEYRAVIAASFAATGDLQRAQARLNLLDDEDPALALVAQAQRYLAEGGNPRNAQVLANLASALGQMPASLPTQPEDTSTPELTPTDPPSLTPTPTATSTPTLRPSATDVITGTRIVTPTIRATTSPTATALPTRTPTITPSQLPSQTPTVTLAPPFVLENQILVCNPDLEEAQMQVFVSNAAGVGIPGVEAVVTWSGGEEHFFTGLKPDIDPGHADFVMTPGLTYTLQVADGGQLIPNLQAPECTGDNNQTYWGSWRFIFSHP